MRDAGVPSRQSKSKFANIMAKTVIDRMREWQEDNFGYYEQLMDMIREGAPIQWLKLYHESIKLGLDKTTNININFNRQQDREALQALVRTRIALPPSAASTSPISATVSASAASTSPISATVSASAAVPAGSPAGLSSPTSGFSSPPPSPADYVPYEEVPSP